MTSDKKRLRVRRQRYLKRSEIREGIEDCDWEQFSDQMDEFWKKYGDTFDQRDLPSFYLIYDERFIFQSF